MTCVYIITFKTIKIFTPKHVDRSFLLPHKCFCRFGTREASLNTLGCVTLQASNGGVVIQWSRFFLQYLGGITSPSFSVSTIKTFERHFFLFSSQFVISEHSHLYSPYSSDYSSYLHKKDFKDPQEIRRSVRILIYVSFVLQTSFISSDNLIGSPFSHSQAQNG